MPLVECVPNFSEGRNQAALDHIVNAIRGVEGASLLDVDPGQATNRTVVTFVADPDVAVEAAFQGIKAASEVIDMRQHTGAHARMGATDVCPFIPVSDITMDECAALARRLAKRVGEELRIPAYLYEYAATRPERTNLASIRAGEYEALPQKLKDAEWAPDFGPAVFDAKAGATVIGARKFLIAYNVNLNTRDRKLAHDIALDIREAGRAKRDENGKIIRDENGKAQKVPGLLKAVKGVGWYIDEYDQAQVSMNLVDFDITPPHAVFDAIVEQAHKRGMRVTGSELVGLIPLRAMLEAGRYYLAKQGKSLGIPERQIVDTAVQSLGLSDITPFDPDEKIIEYRLTKGKNSLVSLTTRGFMDELSTDSPAPGGGSVAALCGALSAALSSMVANLTVGRKGQEDVWETMSCLAADAQNQKDWFLEAVDRDTQAFNAVMAAVRAKTGIEEANQGATLVPLEVLQQCSRLLDAAFAVASEGNPNSLSDAGVAGLTARACAEGAYYNVLINLAGIQDAAWIQEIRSKADAAMADVQGRSDALAVLMRERLV